MTVAERVNWPCVNATFSERIIKAASYYTPFRPHSGSPAAVPGPPPSSFVLVDVRLPSLLHFLLVGHVFLGGLNLGLDALARP